jgi:hypothetical protein
MLLLRRSLESIHEGMESARIILENGDVLLGFFGGFRVQINHSSVKNEGYHPIGFETIKDAVKLELIAHEKLGRNLFVRYKVT